MNKIFIIIIIVAIYYLFFNKKKENFSVKYSFTNKSKNAKYYDTRKDFLYYKKCINILQELSSYNKSIIDVGGWKGDFIKNLHVFNDRTVTDLHKKPTNFPSNVKFISGDFTKINFNRKYDIVTCMQVLEHIPHNKIHQFTQKLFTLGKTVIISIPYKWDKNFCKYHIHDPVDEHKLYHWTKRVPSQLYLVRENNKTKRLIAIYYKD